MQHRLSVFAGQGDRAVIRIRATGGAVPSLQGSVVATAKSVYALADTDHANMIYAGLGASNIARPDCYIFFVSLAAISYISSGA